MNISSTKHNRPKMYKERWRERKKKKKHAPHGQRRRCILDRCPLMHSLLPISRLMPTICIFSWRMGSGLSFKMCTLFRALARFADDDDDEEARGMSLPLTSIWVIAHKAISYATFCFVCYLAGVMLDQIKDGDGNQMVYPAIHREMSILS